MSLAPSDSMPAWRALIVDDEPLAREGMRRRLDALGAFSVLEECDSGRSAIAAIRSRRPDVVFLDVQMPVVDGFGVIAEVGADAMPHTVFVTAHDHYALQAFDAQAIDYVLKPIDDVRLARAVESVRRRLVESHANGLARQLTALLAQVRGLWPAQAAVADTGRDPWRVLTDRLVARDGDRVEVIPTSEIDLIAADGDYVRVYAGGRQLLLRGTLAAMEGTLPPHEHVRIHRSTIVNVGRIRTLRSLPNGEYAVILRNGATVRASRSYADRLRHRFGLGMPNDRDRPGDRA